MSVMFKDIIHSFILFP